MKRLTIALAVAAGLPAGCGASDSSPKKTTPVDVPVLPSDAAPGTPLPPGPGVAALLDRLPPATREIEAMDLRAAKRQLGLAPRVDAARHLGYLDPGRGHFADAAYRALNDIFYRSTVPALRVLDHRRTTAVVRARAGFSGELEIIATAQPQAEIERGLARAGVKRVGDHAFRLTAHPGVFPQAMVLGDGLVVIASTSGLAEGVLGRDSPDPKAARARGLLDSVRGAFRVVELRDTHDEAPCMNAIAGGQRFDARDHDDLLLVLDQRPEAGRVVLHRGAQVHDTLTRDYRVRSIAISGRKVRIDVGVAGDEFTGGSAMEIAMGDVEPQQVYRCRFVPPPPPAPLALGNISLASTHGSPTRLQTIISLYVKANSTASNRIRVTCPPSSSEGDFGCTGTRPYPGGLYHYEMTVHVTGVNIASIDISSPDDRTGAIGPVVKRDR
ncbi:MAG: hypothetical protein QOE11_229 [Solirubrobacteraceae bacterium]|jgi:hypothetical protein|nr:hypothetical protein [Solirubrobacteraceae bacterium]